MKSFKTSFTVCMQNLRKWTGDYRVIIVFIILLIANNFHASWFLIFSNNVGGEVGVAPWIYVFAFTGWQLVKVMMIAPVILLFSKCLKIFIYKIFYVGACYEKKNFYRFNFVNYNS